MIHKHYLPLWVISLVKSVQNSRSSQNMHRHFLARLVFIAHPRNDPCTLCTDTLTATRRSSYAEHTDRRRYGPSKDGRSAYRLSLPASYAACSSAIFVSKRHDHAVEPSTFIAARSFIRSSSMACCFSRNVISTHISRRDRPVPSPSSYSIPRAIRVYD